MLQQAQQEGRTIYNGISYRLNSFKQDGNRLAVELAPFEYKMRDGLVKVPGYFNLSEPYYRKGGYTAATVKTADDKYLMVKLSGKSMNMNTIDTLGGIFDAEPEAKTGMDVFRSLYKELSEEALITEQDIDECYLRALILERQTNIGFYFEVKLKVGAKEIISRQKIGTLDQEIASLLALTKAEYIATLQTQNENKQLIAKIPFLFTSNK